MKRKMFIKINFLILLFIISSTQVYSSVEIKTDITKVTVNNVALKNPLASDIIIEPNDVITFYFSKNYKYTSDKGIVYLIDFDNGRIKKTINDNKITFSKLGEGVYSLNVQAFIDENNEIIPLTIKFIVRKRIADFATSRKFSLPPVAIYILVSILLLEFKIMIILK